MRIKEEKPGLIGIIEVKPKNFRYDTQLLEYHMEGYQTIPLNITKNSEGRGIILYIKEELEYRIQEFQEIKLVEGIFCEVKLKDGDKIRFAIIYRSPSSNEEANQNINNIIHDITGPKYSSSVIVGYLNYPEIDWAKGGEKTPSFQFLEITRDCFLTQHISEPTRGRCLNNPSCIDLLCHLFSFWKSLETVS